MSIECGICERDVRGGHAENCPRHHNQSGTAVINGQRYKRETMQVARVTVDGTTCIVAAHELLDVLDGGGEYTVSLETMPVHEFERLPEFGGW